MEHSPELLCEGFVFPETPRWHKGSFYGCSIDEGSIHRIGSGGSRTLLVEIDDMVSGFCFLDRDSEAMVISSVTRKKFLLWDGDRLSELADLASTGCNLVNDMIRTEGGDCFVGSLCFPEGAKGLFDQVPGPIIRVDPGGNVSIADDEVLFPNGFVITPDGGTLVVASTGWSNLLAYDLGRDGTLSNRRVFATIPGSAPDGIAGEEARSVLEALPAQLNIFRVMAHADTCFAPQLQLGAAILTRQALGHADRELLILLVARLEGGDYEWHQHCPIAFAVGVDQSRIDAIRRLDLGSSHFAERERALLAFGRQATEDVRADGEVFTALQSHFSDREVVEAILTIGFYMTMARLTEATETDLDPAEGRRVFEAARAAADG